MFVGLSSTELAFIEQHAQVRNFPKNAVIVNQGDATDSLYIIVVGKVKVFLNDENDKEVILNMLGPGEYFGELAIFSEEKRSASVMAVQKSTFCIISKQNFRKILDQHPDIIFGMAKNLTSRVRLLSDNIKTLALLDVYGRVAKTLLDLAVSQDGRLIIEDKPTQQELANRVGASREMVSRILRDLAKGSYIKLQGKQIVINEKLPQHY